MVAFSRQSLIRSLPVSGALLVGIATAAAFALMPTDLLEAIVWQTGIAAILPVAAPPLGTTARLFVALMAGGVLAAVAWAALYLLFGPGGMFTVPVRRADGVPVVRRADAHPDAPPRKPLSAADLGQPMMAPVVPAAAEQAIPADLDLPLAAFDPHALLPVPMEPARPVAPLVQAPVASERIETFELTPPVRPSPEPRAEPAPVQTIEALLRRLEEGAGRRRGAGAH